VSLPIRLGDFLVQRGIVSGDQLRIALTEHRRSGETLGACLVRLGFVSETVITASLAGLLGERPIDLERVIPDPDAIALLPWETARHYRVLPVRYEPDARQLTLATGDPRNLLLMDEIAARLGGGIRISPVLAGDSGLARALERHYGRPLSMEHALRELERETAPEEGADAGAEDESQRPVARLVNALLTDAVKRNASDIHLEPERGFARFRYRVDGVLCQVCSLHKDHWPSIAVRVKVMAGLDIAEQRLPQDGHFSLSLAGHTVDFRVSTLPTVYGENIVLRVLDRERMTIALDKLGLDAQAQEALERMLERPEGMILMTGPTGSGKTTTLYALLNRLNTGETNIMTLEDPVEYQLPAVRQCSLDASQFDFAAGVRAVLRQAPDILLIGEIRDEETARMSMRAAMTGHRVFATLHTVSALAALPRLASMGIPPDLLAGHLVGVVAQRLARRLCMRCRGTRRPTPGERRLLGMQSEDRRPLYRAVGCPQCGHSGYRGRLAIMEVLHLDPGLSALVAARASWPQLLERVRAAGARSLSQAGAQRVLEGATDLPELRRVIDLSHLERA